MIELILIYMASSISLGSTLMAITRHDPSHALIYLITSLLASAIIFYLLGAPFAAVLEVVIYAGAIMVLFVFVIMMLNLGDKAIKQEHEWLKPRMWIVPSIFLLLLLAEIFYVISTEEKLLSGIVVEPKQVGIVLFGPYVLAVEISSMLLLAGLIGAYHLGRRYLEEPREKES